MRLELARDARGSANELMEFESVRSCMSRAYYAAYSKVTHELAATVGLTMPPDREGPKLDDDWLYVVVVPSQAGVRASYHAQLMSQIERQLRAEGDKRVLLIPALED